MKRDVVQFLNDLCATNYYDSTETELLKRAAEKLFLQNSWSTLDDLVHADRNMLEEADLLDLWPYIKEFRPTFVASEESPRRKLKKGQYDFAKRERMRSNSNTLSSLPRARPKSYTIVCTPGWENVEKRCVIKVYQDRMWVLNGEAQQEIEFRSRFEMRFPYPGCCEMFLQKEEQTDIPGLLGDFFDGNSDPVLMTFFWLLLQGYEIDNSLPYQVAGCNLSYGSLNHSRIWIGNGDTVPQSEEDPANAIFYLYREVFLHTNPCWQVQFHHTWCSKRFRTAVRTFLLCFKRFRPSLQKDLAKVIIQFWASVDEFCLAGVMNCNGYYWEGGHKPWKAKTSHGPAKYKKYE